MKAQRQKVSQKKTVNLKTASESNMYKGAESGRHEDARNPKVIDLRSVMNMFQQLKSEIKKANNNTSKKFKGIHKKERKHDSAVAALTKQVNELNAKAEVMSGVVQNLTQRLSDNEHKIKQIEWNTMKRSIILTGFYANRSKALAIEQVKCFLSEELDVEVDIIDLFTLGGPLPKPIVITFMSFNQKLQVMKKKKLLAALENEDGQPFFINDYMPARMNERKRREKDILRDNYRADRADQLDMEVKAGILSIEGNPYEKQIKEPNHSDLLDMSPEDIDELLSINIDKIEEMEVQDSTFIGFAVCASSLQEVQRAYHKVRLIHAGARHVVCAYSLQGQPKHMYQDYCDDQETNAGRVMLHEMLCNKVKARAIFAVRYCGKQKIGNARFPSIC